MKNHYVRQRSAGFTLVELLVVLAIIGILVAMVTPAISGAQGEADKASCAKNLKSIAMAAHSFRTSVTRGKKWPASEVLYEPRETLLTGLRSIESLFQGRTPILSSTDILRCPSNGENVPLLYDETYPKEPWTFNIFDSGFLWNPVAPTPADDLNSYYFASDRATNHIDGMNILYYNSKVDFFDQDSFPEIVEDWEQSGSRVFSQADDNIILLEP